MTPQPAPGGILVLLMDLSGEGQQIRGDQSNGQETNLIRSLFGDAYISLWGVVGLIEDKGLDQHGNWWSGVDISKCYGTRTSDAW